MKNTTRTTRTPLLSRRTALRGMGLGSLLVGLPVLDAMRNDSGLLVENAKAADPFPTRFMTYFTPNGLGNGGHDQWILQQIVADAELSHLKDKIAIVSELNKREWDDGREFDNDAHQRGHGSFATGVGISSIGAGGPSIDQILAQNLGGDTKFRSLPVAVGDGASAFPRMRHISWSGANSPAPADRDPQALFSRLFSDGATEGMRDYRGSVLDYVKDDLGQLMTRVSGADRIRLDQHLSAIRDVEKSLATTVTCDAPLDPGGTDVRSNERARALSDLLVLAFACDLTRYSSFMLCNREDFRQFPWIGVEGGGCVGTCDNFEQGHHGMSHDGDADRLDKIMHDQMSQLAYLLDKMEAIPEGDGTMLDNSLVFYTSETNESGSHLAHSMTALLCGKAGGRMNTGLELRTGGAPFADALCSCLNLAGLPTASLGTYGSGEIGGLRV